MKHAQAFTISLADVPIRISCRYEENRIFLQDYLTDRDPLLFIEPTDDDFDRIRQDLRRMLGAGHVEIKQPGDVFLENSAIHALIAEKLVAYDTLLFHGSALCMDGQAYIFTAPSGTGKSTHAGLWREVFGSRVRMINDDKPLIRIADGRATVYGSPWNGKHHLGCNASAPLKAILLLARSSENRLEPMSKADAAQILLRQGYAAKEAAVVQGVLSLHRKLLDLTSFYRMNCNMDPEAAMTAWRGVNES